MNSRTMRFLRDIREGRSLDVFTPDDLEPLCASALAPLKKSAGIYYTPAKVAEKIASDAFDALPGLTAETVPGLRIVDPACGCGAFLAAAMRILHDRFCTTDSASCRPRRISAGSNSSRLPPRLPRSV